MRFLRESLVKAAGVSGGAMRAILFAPASPFLYHCLRWRRFISLAAEALRVRWRAVEEFALWAVRWASHAPRFNRFDRNEPNNGLGCDVEFCFSPGPVT